MQVNATRRGAAPVSARHDEDTATARTRTTKGYCELAIKHDATDG